MDLEVFCHEFMYLTFYTVGKESQMGFGGAEIMILSVVSGGGKDVWSILTAFVFLYLGQPFFMELFIFSHLKLRRAPTHLSLFYFCFLLSFFCVCNLDFK